MNTFLNELKNQTNYTYTENGALTHKSTFSKVYDLFAFGGSFKNHTEEDIIDLFKDAFAENKELALKCLFYLRDVRGGQGERKFFRVCFHWLSLNYPKVVKPLLIEVPLFGRWDDLWYSTEGTSLFDDTLEIIKKTIKEDCNAKTCSLLAKWLPSENASSKKTIRMAYKIRTSLGLSHKEYRQLLSKLRKKINILERLMSENRWDEIEFDKIPSRAGLIYRNTFARKEIIAEKYKKFILNKNKKVNAGVLYPYDVVKQAFFASRTEEQEAVLQKYWDNLPDYFGGKDSKAIAVVDVSGSMTVNRCTPLIAAIAMGTYIAEKNKGSFANHFITFSEHPEIIEIKGESIVEKIDFCRKADWGYNTNIQAVFNLFLDSFLNRKVNKEDLPTTIYIFSDMEFDDAIRDEWSHWGKQPINKKTLFEEIEKEWISYGLEMPKLIFWNLNAKQRNIPALGNQYTYISGFNPVMIEQVLSGKTGIDLMLEKLLSDRYKNIILR